MSNKLTFDEVQSIVFINSNGHSNLIRYTHTHENMIVLCKCNNQFSVLLSNYKKGKIFCNECLLKIRRQKEFDKIAKFIYENGNILLSEANSYVDNKSKLKVLCECGDVFEITYKGYKHKNKRQCNTCSYIELGNLKKRDIDEVYEIFKNKGLIPKFKEDDYVNAFSNLAFVCSKHMNEDVQYTSCNYLVRDSAIGCNHCRNEKLREEFKIKNPRDFFIERGFIPLFENDEYMNSNQSLPFICKEHEDFGIQYTDIANVRYRKGCKYCSDNKSKGELKIQQFLDKVGLIRYKIQDGFADCRHKMQLKFDFLVYKGDDLKLIIEYDGIQHFEPTDFAGRGELWAEERFNETVKRDRIKNEYCYKNNLPLLRIPYWDYDNIEKIIEDELRQVVQSP